MVSTNSFAPFGRKFSEVLLIIKALLLLGALVRLAKGMGIHEEVSMAYGWQVEGNDSVVYLAMEV